MKYFHSVPSVQHKEILYALDQGLQVYGCSSMGALRAAELADFGLVGIGAVFRQYRDGVLTDDEVAVTRRPFLLNMFAQSLWASSTRAAARAFSRRAS